MNLEDLTIEQLENLLAEKKEKQRTEPKSKIHWESPVGFWKVTTEGDCEGRSTTDLGIHEGHISDIACNLAGYSMYGLRFSPVGSKNKQLEPRRREAVHIHLDIESKTWDCKAEERVKMVNEFLGREKPKFGFYTQKSNYYASILLNFNLLTSETKSE